jgi:hypothetical protein
MNRIKRAYSFEPYIPVLLKRLAKRERRSASNYLETLILQAAKEADIRPDDVSELAVVRRKRVKTQDDWRKKSVREEDHGTEN